jgi:hypothetical protein
MKLIQTSTITGDLAGGLFAQNVSVDKNNLIYMAGTEDNTNKILIYENNHKTGELSEGISDYYGFAADIYHNTITVGAPLFDNDASGKAYLYEKKNNSSNFSLVKSVSNIPTVTKIGESVRVYENTWAVGANNFVYIYEKKEDNWSLKQTITGESASFFGCYISLDKDRMVISAKKFDSDRGKIYVYEKENEWKFKQSFEGESPNEEFGLQTTLNGDYFANTSTNGDFTIYKRGRDGVWKSNFYFNSGIVGNGSLALSKNVLIYGNTAFNSNRGVIYAFKLIDNGNWEMFSRINGESANDFYGYTVDINNNYVVVGADRFGNNVGKSYLYKISN